MDRYSPFAPASIRVQIVPVGNIEPARLETIVLRLQREVAVVRLSDVNINLEQKTVSAPLNNNSGTIFYNFLSDLDLELSSFSPFELFREPLIVLGILNSSSTDVGTRVKELEHAHAALREKYPRVVYRDVLLLQDSDGTCEDAISASALTIDISSNDAPCLPTRTIASLTSRFLLELATYRSAIEALPTVQTPGQPLRNKLSRASGISILRPHSAQGSLEGGVFTTSPEQSRTHSRPPSEGDMPRTPSTSFEQIQSSSFGEALSPTKMDLRPNSREKIIAPAFGNVSSRDKMRARGKARVGIVTGFVHLMSGQWATALQMLTEHTSRARALSDLLWFGKGLEGSITALLLLITTSADHIMPPFFHAVLDRRARRFSKSSSLGDHKQNDGSVDNSQSQFGQILPELAATVLETYALGDASFALPNLIIAEASIRLCRMLVVYCGSGDSRFERLRALIVQPTPHTSSSLVQSPAIADHVRQILVRYLDLARSLLDETVLLPHRLATLAGLASTYSSLGWSRKQQMVVRESMALTSEALAYQRRQSAAEAGIHPAAVLAADLAAELTSTNNYANHSLPLKAANLIQDMELIDAIIEPTKSLLIDLGTDALAHRVNLLETALHLCEGLPDSERIMKIGCALLYMCRRPGTADANDTACTAHLDADRQNRIWSMICRTVKVSSSITTSQMQAEFWDAFLLRDIEIVAREPGWEVFPYRKPESKPINDRIGTRLNPLLYDANLRRVPKAQQTRVLLVQDEYVDISITLQNPWFVSFDVEYINIVLDKILWETSFPPLTLAGREIRTFTVRARPSTIGEWSCCSCQIKIAGCNSMTFRIFSKHWLPRRAILVKPPQRSSHLESPDGLAIGAKVDDAEIKTIYGRVVPVMPKLDVLGSSGSESAIELLCGESRSTEISVINVSSTKAVITEIEGTENVLVVQPGEFASAIIEPGAVRTFEMQVQAHSEFPSPRLKIFYTAATDDGVSEYARKLTIPFSIKVTPTLTIRRADILPTTNSNEFMMSIALRNTWTEPLTFACLTDDQRGDETDPAERSASHSGVLHASHEQRLSIVMPKKKDTYHTARAEDLGKDLAKRLKILWEFQCRKGEIAFSSDLFSAVALQHTRAPGVRITHKMISGSDVAVGDFVTIEVHIENWLEHLSDVLVTRLALHSKAGAPLNEHHVAWCGSEERIISPIAPGRTTIATLGFCPLIMGLIKVLIIAEPHHVGNADDGSKNRRAFDSANVNVRQPDF